MNLCDLNKSVKLVLRAEEGLIAIFSRFPGGVGDGVPKAALITDDGSLSDSARTAAALIRLWLTSTPPTMTPMMTSTIESSISVKPLDSLCSGRHGAGVGAEGGPDRDRDMGCSRKRVERVLPLNEW